LFFCENVFRIETLNNELEKFKLQSNTEKAASVNKEKELDDALTQLTYTAKDKAYLQAKVSQLEEDLENKAKEAESFKEDSENIKAQLVQNVTKIMTITNQHDDAVVLKY
jgi:uncharacterized protein (DUF3084 family)